MPLIKRFEDIIAWQQARILTQRIYQITSKLPFKSDLGLCNQIQRASVSAMTNIAEGFDCESKTEFARFLGIARRSVVEVQSLLYVAWDAQYLSKENFDSHYVLAAEVKALIGGFRSYLKRHKKST